MVISQKLSSFYNFLEVEYSPPSCELKLSKYLKMSKYLDPLQTTIVYLVAF